MPYFENDGARLYYSDSHNSRGSNPNTKAPALLFIHGWCSNSSHWREQKKHFARKYRIITLDRRGLGKSTTPGTGHTPKQHALDIAALLRHLKIKRVIAIGHAGGGPVTLELTRSFPKIVKATVMVDSGMYPKADLKKRNTPFAQLLGGMHDAISAPGGKQAFKKMYQGFFGPKCPKEVSRKAVADATKTPMATILAEIDVMASSPEAMAKQIKQPVLWLTAATVDQAYIGKQLKNVQFAQVVGSGHFPQLEVPAQTNAAIETFVSQL